MKSEVREKIEKYTVFIADDGKEFYSLAGCKHYEDVVLKKAPEAATTAINFYDFEGTHSLKIYNIKSIDDWHYLCKNVWESNHSHMHGNYEGPGCYVAEFTDGGDYDDSYYIMPASEYINDFRCSADDYIAEFEEIISKFNT